jgi:hypothetical protein
VAAAAVPVPAGDTGLPLERRQFTLDPEGDPAWASWLGGVGGLSLMAGVLPVRRRRQDAAGLASTAEAAAPVVSLARPGIAPEAAVRTAGGWMGRWLESGDTPPPAQDWRIRL